VRETKLTNLGFKGGGDRPLGDHAGGKDGEDGVALLVPEGGLGDGDVHGLSISGC